MKTTKIIGLRHGDWSFNVISEKEYKKLSERGNVQKHKGEFTFAEGEATGHFHTVKVKEKEAMEFIKMPNGSYLVKMDTEGIATHPEHSMRGDLVVPPAYYHLKQRREKDWFSLETRKVID